VLVGYFIVVWGPTVFKGKEMEASDIAVLSLLSSHQSLPQFIRGKIWTWWWLQFKEPPTQLKNLTCRFALHLKSAEFKIVSTIVTVNHPCPCIFPN
jgi:hypothetical protein